MDFAVIGAQKCATTAVRDWLAGHPQVWMPPGEDDFLEHPESGSRTYAHHVEKLRSRAGTRLLGVKRASYLNKEGVGLRLRTVSPNARLIVVVRNPVDRALSAYLHYSVRGHVPQMSIDLAMRLLLDGSLNEDYPLSRHIIEWGEYGRALQSWLSVWPAESFLVIHQERMRDAPQDVRASLESHLAISGLATVSPRPNRGPYGPYRREWWNVARALEESAPGFGRRLAARGMRSIDVRAFSRFPTKHVAPRLSDDVRAELSQYFRTDQEVLSHLEDKVRAAGGEVVA